MLVKILHRHAAALSLLLLLAGGHKIFLHGPLSLVAQGVVGQTTAGDVGPEFVEEGHSEILADTAELLTDDARVGNTVGLYLAKITAIY